MSRRKQLHPKPVKDRGKDDIEQVCRSHNLPGHILHLQELSDDPELDYSVHSISTILQGSQFGPFNCTLLGRLDEDRDEDESCSVMEIPVFGNPDAKVCLTIETATGRWLRLLRKTTDLHHSNVRLRMQDQRTLWCEVLKNILPDEELVAILLEDGNNDTPQSSSLLLPSISPASSSSVDVGPSSSVKLEAVDVGEETAMPALVPLTALSLASTAAAAAAAAGGFVRWENHLHPPSSVYRRGRQRKSSAAGLFETADIETDRQRTTFSLIHVCMYCGVRFSNPRTLQAHITNYCSKKPLEHHRVILPLNPSFPFRPPSAEAAAAAATSLTCQTPTWFNASDERSEGTSLKRAFEEEDLTSRSTPLLCKLEKTPESIECDHDSVEEKSEARPTRRSSDASSRSECSPGQLCSKNGITGSGGAVFSSCPHCPNSLESPKHLAQHLLRIHSSATSPKEEPVLPRAERRTSVASEYVCSKCNIRFSSPNTYKAHKEFYCQKRSRVVGVKSAKQGTSSSPETAANENALPVSPFCPLPPQPGMPAMFPPGSVVFPSPIFPPPPCLQPISDMCMPQSQAVFLSGAPFLGGSNVPSVAFSVPVMVQPLAPFMPNGMLLQTDEHRASDVGKSPVTMKQEEPSATVVTKRRKSNSESGDEKPLDLSTKKNNNSPIVKNRSQYNNESESPTSKQTRDNERRTNGSPDFRRSATPATASDGIKVCPTRYLSDSVLPIPPLSSSLLVSPYTISNMLPAQEDIALLPARTSDLAPSPGMVVGPPSVSRCVDCNIVFYKHENYVAHREHYCASRFSTLQSAGPEGFARRQSMKSVGTDNRGLIGGLSPSSPRLKAAAVEPLFAGVPGVTLAPQEASVSSIQPFGSPRSPELVATIDNGTLQYYCIPCKIRFSSLDTLKAHKKFYCPSRKPTGDHAEDHQSGLKNNNAEEKHCSGSPVGRDPSEIAVTICSVCGNAFASAQLLKLHYCTGGTTTVRYPLFHCPYCDYIAQSDGRLVDHIKAHAPSKAYKCVLCGYRGNTVRGMRMHGKMHNDAGETFTDDCMIEYEEPPMIPKRLRRPSGDGETDVDLIRLKNEPYKRRRSRKAYEKSEFCRGPAPTRCVECKEMFSDADLFQAHMQTHVADKIRAWKSCELDPNSTVDLLRLQAKLYPGSVSNPNVAAVEKFTNDKQSHVVTKDSAIYSANSDPVTTAENSDGTSKEEQELVDVVETSSGAAENENEAADDTETPQQTDNSNEDSTDPSLTPPRAIKEETLDAEESDGSEKDANGELDRKAAGVDAKQLPALQSNGTSSECKRSSSEQNGSSNGGVDKYCEQCNIIFMYTSTFIAHKKYYCNSHREKEEVPDQRQSPKHDFKHRSVISYLHP